MGIVAAILVFSVIILVHELGHFLAAKSVGIEVEEFALGFGPRLVGVHRGGTWYSLRVFPLGGFVRMLGEEEDEKNPSPNSFQNKTVLQRMLVIAAGPVMNFILALLLFVIIFGVIGVPTPVDVPKIAQLVENHAAQEAGMLPGDLVTHVNSDPVETWREFVKIVQESGGEPLELVVERGGERLDITVTPRLNSAGVYAIGVYNETRFQRLPVLTSIRYGFRQTVQVTGAILVNLYQLVTRQLPADDITGPIGIFYYVGQAAKQGMFDVLFLAALISINLGLFNLLPIPALDGSKLVFLGFEAIRRRPVDPQKENLVHLVGFALLISLMVLVMYRDIVRFFIK